MTTTALGSRIRQARKDKGFTQERLAEELHVTRQTVSNWENDRYLPDYETLARLADVLCLNGVSPLVEADAPSISAPKRRILPLVIAAAVLIIGVAGLLCALPAVDNGGYSLEWFEREQQSEAGKAFVRLYTHEPSVKARRGTPTATPMWRFSIFMKEENGVGFTVERADYVYFSGRSVRMIDSQTEDCLHEGLVTTKARIGFNQYRQIYIKMGADDTTTGMGLALFGTDDNGNDMSFHIYLPFENEYR